MFWQVDKADSVAFVGQKFLTRLHGSELSAAVYQPEEQLLEAMDSINERSGRCSSFPESPDGLAIGDVLTHVPAACRLVMTNGPGTVAFALVSKPQQVPEKNQQTDPFCPSNIDVVIRA